MKSNFILISMYIYIYISLTALKISAAQTKISLFKSLITVNTMRLIFIKLI